MTTPIEGDGPILMIGVLVSGPRQSAMRAAGIEIPSPRIIRGLVDTGASATCIDQGVIGALGLQPTGSVRIHTPSTGSVPHSCDQYDVALAMIMENQQIHVHSLVIPVISVDFSMHNYDALIGRDVLANGLLVYNGPVKSFTLTF